jgi:DNA-binding CsgD family transcriptional regulator
MSRPQAMAAAEALDAICSLAVTAAQVQDLDELGDLTVDMARDLLGADEAWLYMWQEPRQVLAPLATNEPDGSPARCGTILPGQRVTGTAFQSDRPVLVRDYPRSRFATPGLIAQGLKSSVAVPLMSGGRRVGSLCAQSYSYLGWEPEHGRLLWVLGSLLAPTLEANQRRARRAAIDLTPREEQILAGIMAGKPAKSIARAEGIAEATVRVHIRSLLSKFGVNSQLAAAAMARDLGLGT